MTTEEAALLQSIPDTRLCSFIRSLFLRVENLEDMLSSLRETDTKLVKSLLKIPSDKLDRV